jgi:hypothetical protein
MGLVACIFVCGCRSAYYAAWEKLGKQKRDLLRDYVKDTRDEQKEATEQFKDALTRLKELYGFKGGDLEKVYDRLKSDYDRSVTQADAVRSRIQRVEQVAADLFKEWDGEIRTINNERLKEDSRRKLKETKDRYAALHTAMKRAEGSMTPVLGQFKDQVLYLKHNLNAQAIGSLQGETVNIEAEIRKLVDEMNASIAEANAFIKAMPE